jgi:K(+)-stimulated pyrophosphate-energized sodium pump
MNLVSLLIAPAVIMYGTGSDANTPLRVTIAVVAALVVVTAVTISKRRPVATAADAIEEAPVPAKAAIKR